MSVKRRHRPCLAAALLTAVLTSGTSPVAAQDRPTPPSAAYGQRADVMRFAEDMLAKHPGLDGAWLREQLAQARHVAAAAQLIMPTPPGVAKNWAAYRARFVERERIEAGAAFWRANAQWLAQAQARWGVPPEIVVGIVGVETFYGRVMGRFRTLDALATLSFDFPSGRSDRSPFFREQLEALLLWCVREGRDPQGVMGSFAGAVGLPQFMPGSINSYAVDFDGDGRIELMRTENAADVVGSIAHYLAVHGWQRDLPTHYAVTPPQALIDRARMLVPDILPTFTVAQFAELGALLAPEAQANDGLLALVELENGTAERSYVAGTSNFYALTRYNRSSYYALAVIDLGRAVAQRINASPASR